MAIEFQLVAMPVATTRQDVKPGELRLSWLGQAGFLVEAAGLRIVIDAYLSDSLAEKYRGKEFPHTRMSPAPVAPDALRDIDLLFSTHAHTDHLDPGTIPAILAGSPQCRMVVARSARKAAVDRGADAARLITVNADDCLQAVPGLDVRVLPSAHEELRRDDEGNHLFLGYLFEVAGIRFYHSGDCVPYAGQVQLLRRHGVNILLLPVNGRDEFRASRGVPGNFTLDEALDLTVSSGGDYLIGHHFGLFDFNTIDPASGRAHIRARFPDRTDRYLLAEPDISYRFRRTEQHSATIP